MFILKKDILNFEKGKTNVACKQVLFIKKIKKIYCKPLCNVFIFTDIYGINMHCSDC